GSATARGRPRHRPGCRLARRGRADDGARGAARSAHRGRGGRRAPHLRRRALPRARQARGLAPMPGAAVLGTGFAVPEHEISNHDLEARLETSDAWIVSRTGIRTRRTLDGSGFIYGLTLADQGLATGAVRRVLLIGADALTRHVDWEDRTTAILFGDGAGAVVLGRGGGLVGTHLGADGRRAGDLCIAAGGS